jgi:hypothetical protein
MLSGAKAIIIDPKFHCGQRERRRIEALRTRRRCFRVRAVRMLVLALLRGGALVPGLEAIGFRIRT